MTTDEVCWKKVSNDLKNISLIIVIISIMYYLPYQVGIRIIEPEYCTHGWDRHSDGTLTPKEVCEPSDYWYLGFMIILGTICICSIPYIFFESLSWLYRRLRKRYCMSKEDCAKVLEENHPLDEGEAHD